jgi:hypothetical protein
MTLDVQGNVFIAAETRSLTDNTGFTTPDLDIVTVKYDNNGRQQWADVFDGEGNFIDSPHDIGVDSQGNVFVTGYTWRGRNTQGGTGMTMSPSSMGPMATGNGFVTTLAHNNAPKLIRLSS